MAILDFKEIPAPTKRTNRNSDDLDAFEKFAEEFFEKILNADIIDRVNRGQDGGIDIKIKYKDEKCLVSCKHNAHSDKAVKTQQEQYNITTRLKEHDCTRFIGFYSTIPASSLVSSIEKQIEYEQKHGNHLFSYEIFKNTDIESTLLSINSPKGWLFAARYFPNSYIKLFQRFVVPIEYYNINDLIDLKNGFFKLNGPYGVESSNEKPEKIIRDANDQLTCAVHRKFFHTAIKDAIDLFPRYFVYKPDNSLGKIRIENISPAWSQKLDPDYAKLINVECNIPIIISALWSMWDIDKAVELHREYRKKHIFSSLHIRSSLNDEKFYALNIALVSQCLNSELRDLFARLIAFYPAKGIKNNIDYEKEEGKFKSFEDDVTNKSILWELDDKNDTWEWLEKNWD